MNRFRSAFYLLLTVPAFAQQTPPAAISTETAPSATVAVGSDYRLKANDVVSVNVFQEPELACMERIAADGTISMPLVGRIKIVGMNPVAASGAIRAALAAEYLVNPQVSLSLNEATKEYITILGQVGSPGAIALPSVGKVSLLQVIGMAGGFTRLANPGKVTVKRQVGGQETIIKVDAERLAKSKDGEPFEVHPGDVITVRERLF